MSFTVADAGDLTLTAPPNGNIAPPGYYLLFLVNGAGVPSVASFVQLTAAPDFGVSATPASNSVTPGSGVNYTVNVTSSAGFNGAVSFTVSGLPSGAAASFNPTSLTGSGSSTLAVSTSAATPLGTYALTITATSGNLVHTASVNLVVSAAADFTLTAAPSSLTVARKNSGSYTVSISALNAFSGTVALSVSGIPSRTSSSFSPSSITGSGQSTLTISPNKPAQTGTYPLVITGTSGNLSHSANVTLVIQ
jgi:uncharacterized membrane protein